MGKAEIGKRGELAVARYLREHGYTVLTANYRCRFGEIDIIAENGQYIIFVEVKTRREGSISSPLEAVTSAKRRKIVRTAQMYLLENPSGLQPRFDVCAVIRKRDGRMEADYLPDAFDGGGWL